MYTGKEQSPQGPWMLCQPCYRALLPMLSRRECKQPVTGQWLMRWTLLPGREALICWPDKAQTGPHR